MYSRYIDFLDDLPPIKNPPHLTFFSDISNCFFEGFKVIHYSHGTREIHDYAHNFCNKQVRELTEKSDQYFSCIFHNGFRFDMTFLTKEIWLSLWQTRDVSLLWSGLMTLKSYIVSRRVTLIDSVKYYQQPLSKLASSTTSEEKLRIECLFLEFLGFEHPYYSKFFLQELSEDDRSYVLQYHFSGKGTKGTKGMNFEKYARPILTIAKAREGTNRFSKKQKQTRFENKKGNMIMVTVEKAEFGQLNDERYVLTDGISSLPYGHKDLEYIENFKCETL